ncbi:MAG TPA: hypothetical protein VGP28_06565 [Methylocella sp.]|nr:hypothetical protein [Methylocella sp.]
MTRKPEITLDVENFCDNLLATIDHAITSGKIKPGYKGPDNALGVLTPPTPFNRPMRAAGRQAMETGLRGLVSIIDHSDRPSAGRAALFQFITGTVLFTVSATYTASAKATVTRITQSEHAGKPRKKRLTAAIDKLLADNPNIPAKEAWRKVENLPDAKGKTEGAFASLLSRRKKKLQ